MMRFLVRARLRPATVAAAVMLLTSGASFAALSPDANTGTLSGDYLAARIADAEKDILSAATFYRAAAADDPGNASLLDRAVVLTAAGGDVPQALALAKRLLQTSPGNNVAKLLVAADLIKARSYAKAIEVLPPDGASALVDLTSGLMGAWIRSGQGEIDRALGELAKLKGEDWFEPFKLLNAGYIALASGRADDAVKALTEARKLDPNTVRITEAYARALAVAGRKSEAVSVLRDYLTRVPGNPLAAAALRDVQSDDGAKAAVVTPADGVAEALASIGAVVGQEGGLEAAALYLQISRYLEPQAAGGLAALTLGNLLDGSGQSEAAIVAFETIAPDEPFRGLGALRRALALDKLDRTAEAEQAFKEAIAKGDDAVQAYTSYGNMLRGRDRFGEAAAVYSDAVQRLGSPMKADWTLFYFRGIAYERSKEWGKAEGDFRTALKLFPDQPLVMNYLGYSWVDMGRNLDEGLSMIRKASELRPSDGFIVDSLGWAYYRLGRYDEAVDELERAVSLQADDPVIHDHLGDAYWKAGRTLEAQFQWRHARDFGAKGADLELILKKIAEGKLIEKPKDAAMIDGAPAGAEAAPGSPAGSADQTGKL